MISEFLKDYINNQHSQGNYENVGKFIEKMSEFLADGLEDARFAHYKHAIEYISRKYYKRNSSIIYTETSINSGSKSFVKYYSGGQYIITLDSGLAQEEKRLQVGHELGHILISTIIDKIYVTDRLNGFPEKEQRELLANLMNYFMHISQSDHYQSENLNKYCYKGQERTDLLQKLIG